MPSDFKDKIKASVPLLVEMQYFTPMNFPNSFSNFQQNNPT